MKKSLLFSMLLVLLAACQTKPNVEYVSDPASYVNSFIGTGGHGHTFPGATAPFGMIQNSPDTRMDSWDGCSGYHISDTVILGFSLTHLSGTGCNDYGDFRFMPTTGEKKFESGFKTGDGYLSKFNHENEQAEAAYYSAILDDYGVKVELTAGERVAMQRYTYPANSNAHLIIDLKESTLSAEKIHDYFIKIEGDNAVSGFRETGYWAKDQHLYLYAEFSKPFKASGICEDGLHAWVDFDCSDGKPVVMKAAVSAVDLEGAKNNLKSELDGFDFNALRAKTYQKWNDELGRIQIAGNSEKDKTIFYTSLYHSFSVPNIFSDADGRYRAHDLKVYQSDSPRYTIFSLWDTFRAEHPLLNIIQRKRSADIINTFINNYETGGLLPVWELAANETNCMIGYHAIPVIADAYINGITGFDAEKALGAMVKSANSNLFGLDCYRQYGFIPSDCEGESVSKTLEYAYDDWCIATMAEKMGKNDIATEFYQRAQYYKNLFDPSTNFFRGKKGGCFVTPFDPTQVNFMLTEANTWQYNFFAPQDINGHIDLMGGKRAYEQKLNELFLASSKMTGRVQSDITGLIGQYAHGNEPSHQMAYLYDFVGKPIKTQRLVNKIMNELYTDQPDGLCGNEDCGQMSAWYVMSAMGFYPVTPASGYYVIGVPHFEAMTLNLENGKQFHVVAKNISHENRYIKSVRLNGKELKRSYIYAEEILKGGKLVFEMTNQRNSLWGTDEMSWPTQGIEKQYDIVAAPYIEALAFVFFKSQSISLHHIDKDAEIYYTIDGSDPLSNGTRYEKPFEIDKTTDIKVVAKKDGKTSEVIEGSFKKISDERKITLGTEYNTQYEAGGDIALIDLQRGNHNFRVGTWQGYYGVDIVATVDLGANLDLTRLAGSFLQDQGSWIFMPSQVEFFVSNDGKRFTSIGIAKNEVALDTEEPVIQELEVRKNVSARYVRMVAKNMGNCPEWHVGAGYPSWIFCDEFIIE